MYKWLCVLGAVVCSAYPAIADSACDQVVGNLVQNCGFETGSFTDWNTQNAVTGSYFGVGGNYNTGSYAAFFGAVGSTDDSITSQTLATLASHSYVVSFWLANIRDAPGSDFQALWDGVTIFDASTAGFGYSNVSIVVDGVGNDTLSFKGRSLLGDYWLDDVVVATPEPLTVFPIAFGLCVLAFVGFKSKTRVVEH